MAKKKNKRQITLPLVDMLQRKRQGSIMESPDKYEFPESVLANLKHNPRPYQKEAMFNFQWIQNLDSDLVNSQYNQLLFNMATGSGKTDLMASIIIYMYDKFKYQNFLFVANTNSVVNKTRDNFLNEASNKYLFNNPITINGEHINIVSCEQYPLHPVSGVIYLKLTTIQSLESELHDYKENGLTKDQFKDKKLIILADEAHHYNTYTKNKDSNNSSWESVLNGIRGMNRFNKQFEFTATLDLKNDNISDKYRNKIIYKYSLSNFQYDGYSKNIYRLQANNDDKDKMLNAILLSQYRKEIAHNYNIPGFKPVVLFKSNKVNDSNHFNHQFNQMLKELTTQSLSDHIKKEIEISHSNAISKTMSYFQHKNINNLINSLKNDFQPMNVVNANDNAKKDILRNPKTYYQLNTLENRDNPIRAVFAVAKLNEGWDVLNLYDIVRLGENNTGPKQTDSEAQLIGRGARYYPFTYRNKKSYTRRFDSADVHGSDLQFLEALYYHTINQPKYLNNLKESFDKINLQVADDTPEHSTIYTTHVKRSFKNSDLYKKGNLYFNHVETEPDDYFDSINKYGINTNENYSVNLTRFTYESNYNDIANDVNQNDGTKVRALDFSKCEDRNILKEGMSRNSFYRFDKLKYYLPTLNSLNEFITSDKWLGQVKIDARIDTNHLNVDQKLNAVNQYLSYVQYKITHNFRKKRGTNIFKPIPIKEVIQDYSKSVSDDFNGNSSMYELIRKRPMNGKNKKWFVYDSSIVNQLEQDCIDLIGDIIDRYKLLKRYSNVYLFRNEETFSNLKLHQFDSKTNYYGGYMPDFVLYLSTSNYIYQIYIEPKGEPLVQRDLWKQELLESINPNNIEILNENNNVKLYGLKFYRKGDFNNMESELNSKHLL